MTDKITQEQIHNLLQGIRVPPQPQILVDLQMEQVLPDPDIKRIAQLISKDVGLSGTVLKVVNSPFYGLSNKITSIEQAVALLGINSVINICNGITIKGEMSDENIVALTRFWDTATDIAMVCATIAKKVGVSNADEAYALGLFHNAGIPLMMQKFPNYLEVTEKGYDGTHERIIDAENETFSTNHCVVGYFTAKSWNVPRNICQVIAEHHNTLAIFRNKDGRNQQLKTLLAILKLSEHICGNYRILGRQTIDHEWESSRDDILEFLGLTTYDVDDLIEMFTDMGVNVG